MIYRAATRRYSFCIDPFRKMAEITWTMRKAVIVLDVPSAVDTTCYSSTPFGSCLGMDLVIRAPPSCLSMISSLPDSAETK